MGHNSLKSACFSFSKYSVAFIKPFSGIFLGYLMKCIPLKLLSSPLLPCYFVHSLERGYLLHTKAEQRAKVTNCTSSNHNIALFQVFHYILILNLSPHLTSVYE